MTLCLSGSELTEQLRESNSAAGDAGFHPGTARRSDGELPTQAVSRRASTQRGVYGLQVAPGAAIAPRSGLIPTIYVLAPLGFSLIRARCTCPKGIVCLIPAFARPVAWADRTISPAGA
jgi:hypothetical protein